jgi:hypothetical protein
LDRVVHIEVIGVTPPRRLCQDTWNNVEKAVSAVKMGQPYDVANAMAVSRITRWKIVLNYMLIAGVGGALFGLLYGVLSGSL